MSEKITYSSAGVDICAADEAKKRIAALAKSTFTPQVASEIGLFAGAYDIGNDRLMLSSADGVGTKIMIAAEIGNYQTIGIDLVHHCVDDIAVHGAKPLFFLDYIAHCDLPPQTIADIVAGLAEGCKNANCALIGGETAQMPGLYAPSHFDLAGVIIGEVAKSQLITGANIKKGDTIIALPSNGLHTNGYSLARKVLFEHAKLTPQTYVPFLESTLTEALMAPHTLYLSAMQIARATCDIHGMAHITGGGITGNLCRVLPKDTCARIDKNAIAVPKIFSLIERLGDIDNDEMFRAFNMGVGFIFVLARENAQTLLNELNSFGAFECGTIENGIGDVKLYSN